MLEGGVRELTILIGSAVDGGNKFNEMGNCLGSVWNFVNEMS